MYYRLQTETEVGVTTLWLKEAKKPTEEELEEMLTEMITREYEEGNLADIQYAIQDYLFEGGDEGPKPIVAPWRVKKLEEDMEEREKLAREILHCTAQGWILLRMVKDKDIQPELEVDEETGEPAEDDPWRLEPMITIFIMENL